MTVHLSRRYRFAASHRLHSPALTDEENRDIYGKCDNPHGHGHDYEVELMVQALVDAVTGRAVDLDRLDKLAETAIVAPFHHRNLNEEVPAFRSVVPTTENLSVEVDRRLRVVWDQIFGSAGPRLEKVRICETDRNICEVRGESE
jgi:6-pyruvoyltetrahydropterin/6-carboxytetrahydropterin synthase